jgi:hypothetical protein
VKKLTLYSCLLSSLLLFFQRSDFLSQINFLTFDFPRYAHLTREEKRFLIDGEFYQFTESCEKNIPAHATVYCIKKNKSDFLLVKHTNDEYYFAKLIYYLYPRKIVFLDNRSLTSFSGKLLDSPLLPFYIAY